MAELLGQPLEYYLKEVFDLSHTHTITILKKNSVLPEYVVNCSFSFTDSWCGIDMQMITDSVIKVEKYKCCKI